MCIVTQALELTHCVLSQVLGMNFALLEKTPYIVELRAPQWPHIPIFPGKNEKTNFMKRQGANQK